MNVTFEHPTIIFDDKIAETIIEFVNHILYADSEETRSGNRTADKIFDLQESTFWMTVDNTAYPHQVVIDLGAPIGITGFRYLPRAEKDYPGMIKEYKAYVRETPFRM